MTPNRSRLRPTFGGSLDRPALESLTALSDVSGGALDVAPLVVVVNGPFVVAAPVVVPSLVMIPPLVSPGVIGGSVGNGVPAPGTAPVLLAALGALEVGPPVVVVSVVLGATLGAMSVARDGPGEQETRQIDPEKTANRNMPPPSTSACPIPCRGAVHFCTALSTTNARP